MALWAAIGDAGLQLGDAWSQLRASVWPRAGDRFAVEGFGEMRIVDVERGTRVALVPVADSRSTVFLYMGYAQFRTAGRFVGSAR
jgi:hypothetical protein